MNNVKIIDVTLRDGGYRNNFEFTTDYAANAVGHLVDVGLGMPRSVIATVLSYARKNTD